MNENWSHTMNEYKALSTAQAAFVACDTAYEKFIAASFAAEAAALAKANAWAEYQATAAAKAAAVDGALALLEEDQGGW